VLTISRTILASIFLLSCCACANPIIFGEGGMTSAVSPANRLVYGFWPYWIHPDSYQPDWSCLDYVCYFSLDANSDGTLNSDNIGAEYYIVRDTAHSRMVNVPLALTCFDPDTQDEILAYHRDDIVDNLTRKLLDLGADGVCIDFEGVRDTNSLSHDSNISLMQGFMKALHDRLKSLQTTTFRSAYWGMWRTCIGMLRCQNTWMP
jgi:hypothetical protein